MSSSINVQSYSGVVASVTQHCLYHFLSRVCLHSTATVTRSSSIGDGDTVYK